MSPWSKSLSSSEDDETEVEYDDESDIKDDTPITEGDFVVVKSGGKSRFVRYIDAISGGEFDFEGVFLHREAGKVGPDKPVFVPNTKDEASFNTDDVVSRPP